MMGLDEYSGFASQLTKVADFLKNHHSLHHIAFTFSSRCYSSLGRQGGW
jgi:hypothetical protein